MAGTIAIIIYICLGWLFIGLIIWLLIVWPLCRAAGHMDDLTGKK